MTTTPTPTLLEVFGAIAAARQRHPRLEVVAADNLPALTSYVLDDRDSDHPVIYVNGRIGCDRAARALFDAIAELEAHPVVGSAPVLLLTPSRRAAN